MYIIVIVVVSVHAYNIGAVKYDWKILWVVAKYVHTQNGDNLDCVIFLSVNFIAGTWNNLISKIFKFTIFRILAVEVQRVCCKHDCEDKTKSHQVKSKLRKGKKRLRRHVQIIEITLRRDLDLYVFL